MYSFLGIDTIRREYFLLKRYHLFQITVSTLQGFSCFVYHVVRTVLKSHSARNILIESTNPTEMAY